MYSLQSFYPTPSALVPRQPKEALPKLRSTRTDATVPVATSHVGLEVARGLGAAARLPPALALGGGAAGRGWGGTGRGWGGFTARAARAPSGRRATATGVSAKAGGAPVLPGGAPLRRWACVVVVVGAAREGSGPPLPSEEAAEDDENGALVVVGLASLEEQRLSKSSGRGGR